MSPPPAAVWTETLAPGQAWSRVLQRHHTLTLTTQGDGASVAGLFYRADAVIERYNMPDTLKAQHTAFLTTGRVLLSDMGHVLVAITADSCGWHDTITGHQDAAEARQQYGIGTYATLRNACYRNTRDNFLIELAKHELGLRDLHANVNFFIRVSADDNGGLHWVPQHAKSGMAVTLRAEMPVLVVLSNTPHPLDPATAWAPAAVELTIQQTSAPGPDDPCRTLRAENGRAYQLTEALFPTV